jgi:hypothetical protein
LTQSRQQLAACSATSLDIPEGQNQEGSSWLASGCELKEERTERFSKYGHYLKFQLYQVFASRNHNKTLIMAIRNLGYNRTATTGASASDLLEIIPYLKESFYQGYRALSQVQKDMTISGKNRVLTSPV